MAKNTLKTVLIKGFELSKDSAGGAAKGVSAYLLAGGSPTVAGIAISAAVGGISQAASGCTKVVIEDVANRALSQKEYERVASAAWRIENQFWERIVNGEEPRRDGFFDPTLDDRPAAEELLEGVLLAIRSEHEEKKAKFVERIFSNVAYRDDISREAANHFLRMAESLSYREIKLLALLKRPNEVGFQPGLIFDGPVSKRSDCFVIRQQAKGLVDRELIIHKRQTPRSSVVLANLGETLFELMGLSHVPEPELLSLRELFMGARRK